MKDDISVADIAYFAGILDGEGCISLHHYNGTKGRYRKTVVVSNNCKELIYWIGSTFGGNVRLIHHSTYVVEWWSNEAIYDVLSLVKDYLIVKKRNAEIMLDYIMTDSKNYDDRALQFAAMRSIMDATTTKGRSIRVEG